MGIIIRPLLHIVSYALALYLMQYYNILWGVHFDFVATSSLELAKVYLLLWIVFRIWFVIVKRIVSLLALPLQILTLWLIWFVINIAIFYLCQFIINIYLTGIQMEIVSFTWLVIVSFVLSIMVSFVYWILKKLI